MHRLRALFAGAAACLAACAALATPAIPEAELAPRALAALTQVLEAGPGVEQIHAAEVLVEFGHAGQVYDYLRREDDSRHDTTPIYRVIFWRALARSTPSPAERQGYVDRIFRIAATPGTPDRIHAVESAGKLRASPPTALVPVLEALAATGSEADDAFIHWLLWTPQLPDDATPSLIRWLASADAATRLRTAHMLRWLQPRDPRVAIALQQAAEASTEPSLASAIVISAACILHATPVDTAGWKARLETIVAQGEPAAVYHALQGLAVLYQKSDLPRVVPLLDPHAHPDVRVGAAWVILEICRRQK